jgi:hypothetical protein
MSEAPKNLKPAFLNPNANPPAPENKVKKVIFFLLLFI